MKIGIVGGYGHECIKLLPGAELAWAWDEYDQQASKRAEAFGCSNVHPSFEAMVEDFQPDIVYVGSAYALNGGLAIKALERGVDVICEKPIATDYETLERIRQLTASGERRIIAEFAMRWTGALQKARELIRTGAIGDPVMIQAQKTYKFGARRPDFYKSRELYGGTIPWVAVHAIDYAAWCAGLRYESVTARHGNRTALEYPGMEDHAAMFFAMSDGVDSVITADFLRPAGAASHGDDRLRVTGTSGVLEARNEDVFLTDAQGEKHWECPTTEEHAAQRAIDLAEAALGVSTAMISTAECIHIAEAALAAREAADRSTLGRGASSISISNGTGAILVPR